MKALVTGGAGFIGSWIVDYLVEKGFDVSVLDNLSTGSLNNLKGMLKRKIYVADIRDKYTQQVFEKERPDYVFHCAAEINVRESLRDPKKCIDVNVNGSFNLLENCVKYGVKKFIFSSTGGAIYGDGVKIPTPEGEKEKPASPYGKSKLLLENYLKYFKGSEELDYVSLRYANVYGPRQNAKGEAGVVAIFIENLLSGKQSIINGDGSQTRDYVYVRDVARANLLASDDSVSGIFNVGTGIETEVNEIYKKIIKILGLEVIAEHGPAIEGEQMRSCLDAERLMTLGWRLRHDLDFGLIETVNYFKKQN